MVEMKSSDFNKLSKAQRYQLLKEKGDYVAARIHAGYNVSLFTVNGLYVEVWQRFGLNIIDYIEVLNSQSQLSAYLDHLDIDPNELLD